MRLFFGAGENNCGFDSTIGGSREVVGRASRRCHVERGLATAVAGVEGLEKVELTAARGPLHISPKLVPQKMTERNDVLL